MTVSYTHLDVYKRQVVYNNFFNESRLSVGDMFYFETTIYDMPEGVYTMELSDDR